MSERRGARTTVGPQSVAPIAGAPLAAPLAAVTGFKLRRLHSQVVLHWQRWFRGMSPALTPVQGGILMTMAGQGVLTQVSLARLMGIEAPTLAPTLSALVAEGLVERARSTADGRAVALTLTAAGRAAAAAVAESCAAQEADALAALTPAERRQFLALLDKALASTEAAIGRIDGTDMR